MFPQIQICYELDHSSGHNSGFIQSMVFTSDEKKGRVVEGYVNKSKGAAQILCESGFIDVNGCFPDGSKVIGVILILTPKYHPEIAGRGVEYAGGYSKLRFRQYFNDAVARNLNLNVLFTNV